MASTLTEETTKPDQKAAVNLPLVCLALLAGLVISLQIIFKTLPEVWFGLAGMPKTASSNIGLALLGIVLILAGFFYLGKSGVFSKHHGLKGGTFVALVLFLLNLWFDSWWGKLVENWVYQSGSMAESAGIGFAATGAGLALIASIVFFFRPSNKKLFCKIEDQGWFSWEVFKFGQGTKVRRGTIVGFLVLFGSGIFVMAKNDTLGKGTPDWSVDIPFTGKVTVEPEKANDALQLLLASGYSKDNQTVSRSAFQIANKNVDPSTHVKIGTLTGDSKYKTGEIVSKEAFQDEVRELNKQDRRPAETVSPKIAEGKVGYKNILLLPSVQFTGPVVLLFLAIWISWRAVNLPVFADFLISTEAEMVKVSWSSKKKLIQDTIVVLTTLVLMSVFLFAMDQFWRIFLSKTGVLRFGQENTQKNTSVDLKKW